MRANTAMKNQIDNLEVANHNLAMDLAWEKMVNQKLMAQIALTKPVKKVAKLKVAVAKAEKAKEAKFDALGQHFGNERAELNTYIIPLIEKGMYSKINAESLSAMSGGQFSVSRFKNHLSLLRRINLI
jgi:hypothetical protein